MTGADEQRDKDESRSPVQNADLREERQDAAYKDAERNKDPQVEFRVRRKSRKKRSRKKSGDIGEEESDGAAAADEEKEMNLSELLLMKEAQKMRAQNRRSTLDIHGAKKRSHGEQPNKHDAVSDDDVVEGLRSNFAAERSGHVVEEQMAKYIDEKMKEKFGERPEDEDRNRQAKRNDENDLFAVPDRLKFSEGRLYDPTEGMPAGGVEEVEVSADARRKNVEETVRAHRELLANNTGHNKTWSAPALTGNFSANFAQHRSEWLAQNLGSRSNGQHDIGDGKGAGESVQAGQEGAGRRKGVNPAKGKRFQPATDAAIADRFRKRWKK